MAKLPSIEELGKKIAEEALDGYIYMGKTLREWIDEIKQTRWIPVSDPLNELPKDRRLLVTVEEEVYPGDIRCYVTELHYDMTEWIESIHDAENTIAYQCYPEPYNAEREDQNYGV